MHVVVSCMHVMANIFGQSSTPKGVLSIVVPLVKIRFKIAAKNRILCRWVISACMSLRATRYLNDIQRTIIRYEDSYGPKEWPLVVSSVPRSLFQCGLPWMTFDLVGRSQRLCNFSHNDLRRSAWK